MSFGNSAAMLKSRPSPGSPGSFVEGEDGGDGAGSGAAPACPVPLGVTAASTSRSRREAPLTATTAAYLKPGDGLKGTRRGLCS